MIPRKQPALQISEIELFEEGSGSEDCPNMQSQIIKESKDFKMVEQSMDPPMRVNHPQIIDEDVENFTSKLDTLIASFRNESIKEFLGIKRSILHEQITTIDQEKKKCSAQLGAKQDEIEHLKEEVAMLKSQNLKFDLQKESLALCFGTCKANMRAFQIKTMAFNNLLRYHKHRTVKKRLYKAANVLGNRFRQRFVFQSLKAYWIPINQQKKEEKLQHRIMEEKNKLGLYYNKEIQSLQERLDEATQQIQILEEQKVNVQENLKQAFMRGVCAMNFEAMNIINPSQLSDLSDQMSQFSTPRIPQSPPKSSDNSQFIEPPLPTPPPQQLTPQKTADEMLNDIQNRLPAVSKDNKWKPAPVYGRPQTAPEIKPTLPSNLPANYTQSNSQLPSNLPTNYMQSKASNLPSNIPSTLPSNLDKSNVGEGKTIFVNQQQGPTIKGSVPRQGVIRKATKK